MTKATIRSSATLVVASLLLMFGMRPAEATTVNSIGAFTGTYSEGWELYTNYNLGGNYNNPLSIMGGTATLTNSNLVDVLNPFNLAIYQTAVDVANFGLGFLGTAQSIGNKGLGLDDSFPTQSKTKIVFATPMNKFGAYWAAANEVDATPVQVTVTFYDQFDVPLGDDVTFTYGLNGILAWHGWETVGLETFSSLSFVGSEVVIDSLQASAFEGPEPASMAMFAIGIAGLAGHFCLRRRRGN
ncbi:MAG: PEP-CTERM sorting domain-containing protein [Planctomycetia bacterium]|nr:PEP-CTERM sorting domain-containing protein [Planctomycetia bacterium]